MIVKLDGKVCIVTGGGSGLGQQMSIAIAKEGGIVVVADINKLGADQTCELVRDNGGQAISIEMDITNTAHIEQMIETVLDKYNRIDVLCNNAGITGEHVVTHEVSEQSWDNVINVNLKSIFLMSKRVIPQMVKQGKGVIINTASASGLIASAAGIEYTAAKHGVVGMTKQLAYEYGHQGVRVVAIAPGVIQTPLTKEYANEEGYFHKLTMDAPAGRYGKPTDVANTVVFLASEDADFIHGHTIPIEGGSTIL